jgi:hypothetical protein
MSRARGAAAPVFGSAVATTGLGCRGSYEVQPCQKGVIRPTCYAVWIVATRCVGRGFQIVTSAHGGGGEADKQLRWRARIRSFSDVGAIPALEVQRFTGPQRPRAWSFNHKRLVVVWNRRRKNWSAAAGGSSGISIIRPVTRSVFHWRAAHTTARVAGAGHSTLGARARSARSVSGRTTAKTTKMRKLSAVARTGRSAWPRRGRTTSDLAHAKRVCWRMSEPRFQKSCPRVGRTRCSRCNDQRGCVI